MRLKGEQKGKGREGKKEEKKGRKGNLGKEKASKGAGIKEKTLGEIIKEKIGMSKRCDVSPFWIKATGNQNDKTPFSTQKPEVELSHDRARDKLQMTRSQRPQHPTHFLEFIYLLPTRVKIQFKVTTTLFLDVFSCVFAITMDTICFKGILGCCWVPYELSFKKALWKISPYIFLLKIRQKSSVTVSYQDFHHFSSQPTTSLQIVKPIVTMQASHIYTR